MSASHLSACDLAIVLFKVSEKIRVVDVVLGYVIEEEA